MGGQLRLDVMQNRRRRRIAESVEITLLVFGFVLFMPLWIPASFVIQAIYYRRLRKAANSFACVRCGKVLGVEALAQADEAWSEHVRELMRLHPGVMFRLVRTVHAICPGCGTKYTFREHAHTFVVEEARPSGVRA